MASIETHNKVSFSHQNLKQEFSLGTTVLSQKPPHFCNFTVYSLVSWVEINTELLLVVDFVSVIFSV